MATRISTDQLPKDDPSFRQMIAYVISQFEIEEKNLITSVINQTVNLVESSLTVTTGNLANDAYEFIDAAIGKLSVMRQIITDAPVRVRAYSTAAFRAADANRAVDIDNTNTQGLLHESVTTAGNLILDAKRAAILFNADNPRTNLIYLNIQNLSGAPTVLNITLVKLVLET